MHEISIEMYAFLLNWSPRSVEKVNVPDEDVPAAAPAKSRKGRGGKPMQPRAAAKNKASEWSWKDQVVPILALISKVLKLKTSKIWTVSGERDIVIGCVVSQAVVNTVSHDAPRDSAGVSLRLRTTSRKMSST